MDCWAKYVRIMLTLSACALLPACTRIEAPRSPLQARVQTVSELPGAFGSNHPQLRQELQQLNEQRQLPGQLETTPPVNEAPYASFVEAYPALTRPAIQREVNAIWPKPGQWFEPGALQKGRELVTYQGAARSRFAAAVASLDGRPQLRITDALLADDEWLDAAITGCRLEGLAAAEALAEQQPAEAIPLCERMLLVSRQLASEPSLNGRLLAVSLRANALQVASAIANHPAATVENLQQLQQRLLTQTAEWPSDERVLQMERAQGLLLYELVRSGHYSELLRKEQRSELERKGLLRSTETAARRDVDADELFYLRAMGQQVAAARQPYLQRIAVCEALQTELETREQTGDFPLVAGTLLLPLMADIHLQLTQDRSRCEAWLIALTAVSQPAMGALPVCALTGAPYELQQDREIVRITNLPLLAGEVIEVRRPGAIQARRKAAGFDFSPTQVR
ncbi:hypothetical protein NA78x_004529 [Anatilimnocola sp. NA78]|uniref:hypothetical protein n=1 Tax=Anatilimnocola sp. NA78 TaxID=3415683 RepID=UPI003CE54A4E